MAEHSCVSLAAGARSLLCIFISKFTLLRLKEGLKTLGVLEAVRQHPGLFKEVFCAGTNRLTAEQVKGIFAPQYSRRGTAKRSLEAKLLSYWNDFLQDTEGVYTFICKIVGRDFILPPCAGMVDFITYGNASTCSCMSTQKNSVVC